MDEVKAGGADLTCAEGFVAPACFVCEGEG
jgi:hypothetical protein